MKIGVWVCLNLLMTEILSLFAAEEVITRFGANERNAPEANAKAIQTAIDVVAEAGGGRVVVPAGVYETGSVILRSNVELYLDAKAKILGSKQFEDYPLHRTFKIRSQKNVNGWCALVYSEGTTNIAVSGAGTIDGRGMCQRARTRFDVSEYDLDGRSRNILFVSCRGVRVSGVTLRNPAMWNQHYFDCEDVVVENVRVFARANYNNDAIDIDSCRHVVIRNCDLDSADDGIVLKNTTEKPCEDVLISDCRVSSQATAIKFGTESLCGFKRVKISNIQIFPSKISAEFQHPYKMLKGISALEISTVDGAIIEDVNVDGVNAVGVGCAVFLRVGNRARPLHSGCNGLPAGYMRRVRVANLTSRETGNFGASVTAFECGRMEDILLENVVVESVGGVGTGDFRSADKFKDPVKSFPGPHCFGLLPSKGLFLRHAGNVVIKDWKFNNVNPDVRPEKIIID